MNTDTIDQSAEPTTSVATGWRKVVYLAMAGMFFVLGGAGAVLPGLPATPFLLLTSFFLLRSSPRLNEKLQQSRVFGPILVDWQLHGGVRLHVKVKAIVVVVLTMAFTICMSGYSVVLTTAVITFAAIGIAVICLLPVPVEERE